MEDNGIKSTFDDWLVDLFVTRVREQSEPYTGPNNRDWYDWEVDPEIEVNYISRLFSAPVDSTQKYTDDQIKQGLWLLVSFVEVGLWDLFNERIPLNLRIQTVKHMYNIFEQLFAPRCTPDISAFQTKEQIANHNPLNSICFMWWDIIPLYGKSGQPEREVLDPYCIEVMERTLHLDSIACQEGALHGLGHWARAYPEEVQRIIDDYLAREKNLLPKLRDYALDARHGSVL